MKQEMKSVIDFSMQNVSNERKSIGKFWPNMANHVLVKWKSASDSKSLRTGYRVFKILDGLDRHIVL